jgi:hypothetical protein
LYISKVLKILYSPQKTLKEVIQEPKYIGPLLILILVVAVNIASAYVIFSKEYYQQVLPSTGVDTWTQSSSYWTSSNANVSQSGDSINETYYGNTSIAFSNQNSFQVSMKLGGAGSVNCSAQDGYNLLSFRIKWTSPQETPNNMTMEMYSANSSSDYFYDDLTATFSNSTYNIWNNFTIPLGSGWPSVGQPDWNTITGLQLQFTWGLSSNITLLIDGLFFRGPYEPLLLTAGATYPLSYGVPGALQYIMTWVLLTGMIYLVVKAFKGKIVWKPMLIAVGFLLITMFIGTLISGIGYATLPNLHYPFDLYGGVPGEGTAALKTITDQAAVATNISLIAQIFVWVWTAALAMIAVRQVTEFPWLKSALVAAIAYTATIFLVILLIG